MNYEHELGRIARALEHIAQILDAKRKKKRKKRKKR